MTIGITGSTGFVGSHLVRHFAKQGHTVIAYGRQSQPPKALLSFAKYVCWNLDSKKTPPAFVGDVFIHAAGYVNFSGSFEDMFHTNVEGTKKALQVAKKARHFIYISSASVYSQDRQYITESSPYPTTYPNHYGETKALAEQLIEKNRDSFQSLTIIRPHAIYGPADRTLLPRLIKSIKGNFIFLICSGEAKYSITHVGNLCLGISCVLNNKPSGFEIYNITDQNPKSIKEIETRLFSTLKKATQPRFVNIPQSIAYIGAELAKDIAQFRQKNAPIFTKELVQQLTQDSTLSIEKAKKQLQYKPEYQFEDGVKDIQQWLNSIGGIEKLNDNSVHCWSGKLFTY